MQPQPLYSKTTNGITITVRPVHAPEHSDPHEPRHVFIYYITIENQGDRTVQLLWRHWNIHDDAAGDTEVTGEGVVGEQPVLAPGDEHEYNSFCVLRGRSGYMEGYYHFRSPDGTETRAEIPRFHLRA